jgi:hypothetical protein
MLTDEFIKALSNYFGETRPELSAAIEKYIHNKHIGTSELDMLYESIQLNCDRFPLVKTIDGLRKENLTVKNDNGCRRDWSTFDVINHILGLGDKMDDIRYYYDILFRAYGLLNELPEEILPREESARILGGVKFDIEAQLDRRKIDYRIYNFVESKKAEYLKAFGKPIPESREDRKIREMFERNDLLKGVVETV